jgi:hypothetical protein
MTATPADAHQLGASLFLEVGPALGCHVACRTHALLVLAAARALQLQAEYVVVDTHAFVHFGDGTVSEHHWGNVRLVPPPAVPTPPPARVFAASKRRA